MNINDLNNDQRNIIIAGETVAVNRDDNVVETLDRVLTAQGIDNFTIILNGEELQSTGDLPNTFGDCAIEVQKNVKSG